MFFLHHGLAMPKTSLESHLVQILMPSWSPSTGASSEMLQPPPGSAIPLLQPHIEVSRLVALNYGF